MKKSWQSSYWIFALFLLSGASSLIYEIVWSRQFVHVFGANLYAATVVLSVFLSGLALGSYVAGNVIKKYDKPLLVCALCEVGIGLSALLLSSHFEFTACSKTCEQIIILSTMLISASFMGLMFPVLCRFGQLQRDSENFASYLYAVNTCGAVIGAFWAGFYSLPVWGVLHSIYIAVTINVGVAIGFFGLEYFLNSKANSPGFLNEDTSSPKSIYFMLLAVGLIGASLEIVWIRLFSLVLGSSSYALSAVLVCILFGIAAGAATFSCYKGRLPARYAAWILILGSIFLYFDLWLLPQLSAIFLWFSGHLPNSFNYLLIARFLVIIVIATAPAFALAGVFPLCLKMSHVTPQKAGKLYAVYCLGTILGFCLTGFVLIPELGTLFVSGIQASILILLVLQILLALMFMLYFDKSKTNSALGIFAALLMVALIWVAPRWDAQKMSSGIALYAPNKYVFNKQLMFYREGLNTTVTVEKDINQNLMILKNDGKAECSIPIIRDRPAPYSDISTQILLGKLPILLHQGRVKNAFLIGFGSGTTYDAMHDCDNLIVCELEPAVIAASKYFKSINEQKEKTNIVIGDGRQILARSHNDYDLIVSQPPDPWVNGATDLFTLEFWKISKSRLRKQGIFCQWIQLYSVNPEYLAVICRTFAKVFPNILVVHQARAGEIILLGSADPILIDRENLKQRMQDPSTKNSLLSIGIHSYSDLLDTIIGDNATLARFCLRQANATNNFCLNTDDNLLTEYRLPRQMQLQGATISTNLKQITNRN